MALITTPGAVDADSYISIAEANSYLAANSAFIALSDPNKEALLRKATIHIDSNRFFGVKADSAQALEFPRTIQDSFGLWDTQTTIIPKVKLATAEQAAYVLAGAGEARAQAQADGVSSYSIGDLSETFNGSGAMGGMPTSVTAKALLRGLISRVGFMTVNR